VNQFIGESRGWESPADGYPASDLGDAATEALLNLRSAHPDQGCNAGKVPPLVLVPGLTSSAINYKLNGHSAPPAWAPWCNRSSDGWQPLWPIPQDDETSMRDFVCWAADVQVK
jgi:hypothetical protein